MPYIKIGRKTLHHGKTLWEILGNLKDYGVGRLITRGTHLRYEEPCFFKVLRVFPQPHDPINEPRKVAVWAEKVFRGRKYPDIYQMRQVTYKSDFQLIPKEEEHLWYERAKEKQHQPRVLADTLPTPPLLKELLLKEAANRGKQIEDLRLKLKFQTSPNNYIKIVDSNDPKFLPETGLGTPFDNSLYNNLEDALKAQEALKDVDAPFPKTVTGYTVY